MEIFDRKPNVLCVFDDFTFSCMKPECNKLITLPKRNWKDVIDENNIDFFFVESTWKPVGNSFRLAHTTDAVTRNTYFYLKSVITYLNKKKIPTVFWNKEDNKFFEQFSVYAPLFDYVFTTDIRTLSGYKKKCSRLGKTKKINTLIFGAQPILHNPIKEPDYSSYEGHVFFAGGWYNFVERVKELEELLNLPRYIKLHIYDRRYTGKGDSKFPFKFRYRLKKGIPYREMCRTYKKYPVMISVNSVKGSKTMFARRVPEALLCKTSVITSSSISIARYFPEVFIKNNRHDVTKTITTLLNNKAFRIKHNHTAMRNVLLQHTYFNRMVQICKTIDIKPPSYKLKVVILYFDNDNSSEKLLLDIKHQNYPYIVKSYLKIDSLDILDDIFINRKINNEVIEDLGFVSFMSSEYAYSENYITDSILSFQFNENIDIIGKGCYNRENKYINVPLENRFTNNINMYSINVSLKGDESKRKEKLDFVKGIFNDKKISPGHNMNILSIDRFSFTKK